MLCAVNLTKIFLFIPSTINQVLLTQDQSLRSVRVASVLTRYLTLIFLQLHVGQLLFDFFADIFINPFQFSFYASKKSVF